MEYTYVDFLAYQGYKALEQFPSSCATFKVERDGTLFVAKIGDQMYNGFPYRHVLREHEVLKKAADIEGIPKEILFRHYEKGQPMVLLIREYLDGKMLYDLPRTELQKSSLEAQVEALHSRGVAGFDIRDINVLVKPGGKAGLIDFGSGYFQSEKTDEVFPKLKIADRDALQLLFKQYQNI